MENFPEVPRFFQLKSIMNTFDMTFLLVYGQLLLSTQG